MPDIYSDVITDVKNLREEAKRYGYNALLEKFVPRIDEAIHSMLEQDPFEEEPEDSAVSAGGPDGGLEDLAALGGEPDPAGGLPGEESELQSDLASDLPLAATEGEKACQCPDEDEEIEIDFDSLMKVAPSDDDIPVVGNGSVYEGTEPEDLEEIELGELEEYLTELAETLEVDFEPTTPEDGPGTPRSKMDRAEDETIASMMDDDRKEEFKQTQKALDQLKENYKKLKKEKLLLEKQHNIYEKKIKDFEGIVLSQQEKLRSLTTMNSRLLYVNKALTNESLNGLQKAKIVETLEKAKTPEEARLIFETAQSTVGSQQKNQPKSRREVASNSPQTLIAPARRKQQSQESLINEAVVNRFQLLAGLKKVE